MKLIFMSGLPGVGKLTVAKELSVLTGCKLFHNHLVVDLLLSVFPFGSPQFVELRESIWLSVFDQASRAGMPGLIFTFNAENTVRQAFVTKMQGTIRANGGTMQFVELICDDEELRRRMDTPSRRQYTKLTSWAKYEELKAAGAFSAPKLPEASVVVDTGKFDPKSAALQIAKECGLGELGKSTTWEQR
ncbi:MAG: shikimate kinase [Candidatus Acidoferrum typicum]|nr:shikimate kinase [Candidatus Acidoferrum typicum]